MRESAATYYPLQERLVKDAQSQSRCHREGDEAKVMIMSGSDIEYNNKAKEEP